MRKLINPRSFVIFALSGLAGVALLHVSGNVQRAEERLLALEASIAREKEQILMLNAEWMHLNRPARLEKLADDFLDLAPVSPSHIMLEEDVTFPELLPIEVEEQGIPEEAEPQARAVSFAPPVPALKPRLHSRSHSPSKPPALPKIKVQKERPVKDFSALLDELGKDELGKVKGGGEP